MANSFFKFARNIAFALVAVLGIGAMGGAGWYYYGSQLQQQPPSSQKPSPSERPRAIAVIALDPLRQPGPVESPSPGQPVDTRPEVNISIQPLERFNKDVRTALAKEFAAAYPQVGDLNLEARGLDSDYRDSAFRLLDAAEKASDAQKPGMLLAADFMLAPVWCPAEYKQKCDPVRDQFAEHKLSLSYSELDGGSYYRHDLLSRIWEEYPASEWGERAFVLLLSFGWDPSGTCARGGDQFRDVIRKGESFLEQHRYSPNRAWVTHLVGQAYATWWSLSNTPSSGMEDYVDPKAYQEGSEQARLKAISYFEQVLELSPGTGLGEYSRQVLPALREKKMTTDSYRFYCVYD